MTYKKHRKYVSLPFRLIRSIAAILVLSALVLGISQIVSYGSKIVSTAPDFPQKASDNTNVTESTESSSTTNATKPATLSFKIAIMSDSHENDEMLRSALEKAKSLDVKAVFYLGDYTNFGVTEALEHAKEIMDASGVTYYSLPGDHDLYKVVGPENFIKVFDENYTTVEIEGTKFILLDNSANYTKIPDDEMKWFRKEVENAKFLLLSQPIYANFLNRKMGVVNGEVEPDVLSQAYEILRIIRAGDVKAVLAGDLHMSGDFTDPEKADLRHYYIGSIAKTNSADGIVNLQVPKFSILSIFDDGSYSVEDVKL